MTPRAALVVDDDPLLAHALRRRLEVNGCSVVVASSMTEALAAAESADDWLVFLVDLHLPEGGEAGLELLASLRRRWPHVPAALMSGVEDFGLLAPAARVSAQYIPKGGGDALVAFVDIIRPAPVSAIDRLLQEANSLGFTPREVDVALSVARQDDPSDFCATHGMKPRTVRNHSANAVAKTGHRSLLSFLVALAYRTRGQRDEAD